MAFLYSVELRNAGLDARIAAIGPRPTLTIYADTQAIGSGEPTHELAMLSLPSKWMGEAENGAVSNLDEWKGRATGEGEAESFRICSADGTCHIEGAIPDDMKLDNPNLAVDQIVTVSQFTIRSGNG